MRARAWNLPVVLIQKLTNRNNSGSPIINCCKLKSLKQRLLLDRLFSSWMDPVTCRGHGGSIKITSASKQERPFFGFLYISHRNMIYPEKTASDVTFFKGKRSVGHRFLHLHKIQDIIDSDRRWVTASILSGSTQVDNDFSIISVAGPDQCPRGAPIML